MKLRPFHIWWLGILIFAPAILLWVVAFIILFTAEGTYNVSFDWYGIRHIYLPFLAAWVGLITSFICLWFLRKTTLRIWLPIFLFYIVIMLMWGIVDIRCENYQVGGHRCPNGPLIDGHKYYFHNYYTWYFLPYRWIEKGIDEQQFSETDNEPLVRTDLNDYGYTDRMAEAVELERNGNTSKIKVVHHKRGGSMSDSMFVMLAVCEVAKARNYEYFTNLKEWDDPNGGRIYIAGFTNKKDADIKKEFGEQYNYEFDSGQKRNYMSVSQINLLFEK